MAKYTYDQDYFSVVDSEDKAYWLGFLYADGSITCFYNKKSGKLKSMSLEMTLCGKDEEHLNKFRRCLKTDAPLQDRKIKLNDKNYSAKRITVNCTKLCRDLINLKCTPHKTYVLKFPTYDIVPKQFMRDFIRGFFDGDGCICSTTMANKPHIILNITGMSDMLLSISDFLIEEKIIRVKPKLHQDNRSVCSGIFFYGTDSNKELLDYLYGDSNIYLDRKYQKYIDFYKGYDDKNNKRGVYYSKQKEAYIASIYINNKRTILGQFDLIEDAIEARKDAEIEKMKILNSSLNQ